MNKLWIIAIKNVKKMIIGFWIKMQHNPTKSYQKRWYERGKRGKFLSKIKLSKIGIKKIINCVQNKNIVGPVTKKDMQTPPPLQKWPPLFMIGYGAQCSESNGSVKKKNFRFLFSELSSKIDIFFRKKTLKWS